VGQEVYGAGMPFGIVARNYWRVTGEDFMIYVDYPIEDFSSKEMGKATFHVLGDPRLACRLRIMPYGRKSLPDFQVQADFQGKKETLKGYMTEEGHMEYELFGDHTVTVNWSRNRNGSRNGKE
jgi:hypothetical protein